jgi:spore maturation protein CgeB
VYFHGHSVGGTNPSLLEAMAAKALIAAHDNSFNRSILNDDAVFFKDPSDVLKIIQYTAKGNRREKMVANNFEKIKTEYNWPMIINCYEQFLYECYAAKNYEHIILDPGQAIIPEGNLYI